jgi:regulator of sigma E protease
MDVVYLLVGISLVLGVMVLIHEWGHFIVARMCGVRVDVFSIGFGPRLFGWKRGATDYRVSALPLGGYVRMAGQDLSDVDAGETAPTGAPDELMSKARWKRALISFAGPLVNLIFPIFLLTGLFTTVGIPYSAYLDAPVKVNQLPASQDPSTTALKPGDLVVSINGTATKNWEQALTVLHQAAPNSTLKMQVQSPDTHQTEEVSVKNNAESAKVLGYAPIHPVIDQVAPGTPAEKAGVREGDMILAVNGTKIDYWEQFKEMTQASNGQPMTLDIKRNGQPASLVVTPKKDVAETGENVYQIGVLPRDQSAYKKVSFSESVRFAGFKTVDTIQQTVDVVGKLFAGRVSIKQLQGPVGISHMAGQAVRRGPLDVISLMVLISINLGILNLLPIPILDGGNILLLAIEGVMRRDLSMSFKERFVQVGLVFLLVIFAIVMYNDILRRIASHT